MWNRIKLWFKDSETILWARLQMALGTTAMTLTYVDPALVAPVLPADWLPGFLLLNGFATEYLRRRRDEAMR